MLQTHFSFCESFLIPEGLSCCFLNHFCYLQLDCCLGFPSLFGLFFETGCQVAQAGLELEMTQLKMTLKFQSCLHFPNSGVLGLYHHNLVIWYWGDEPRTSCMLGKDSTD